MLGEARKHIKCRMKFVVEKTTKYSQRIDNDQIVYYNIFIKFFKNEVRYV